MSTKLEEHIKKHGTIKQVLVAVEEMAELQKELLKNVNRAEQNRDKIFNELTDVYLMLRQIQIIYDFKGIEVYAGIKRKEDEL